MVEKKAKWNLISGARSDSKGYRLAIVFMGGRWGNNDTFRFYDALDVILLGFTRINGGTPKFDNKVIDKANRTVTFTFSEGDQGANLFIGAAMVLQGVK